MSKTYKDALRSKSERDTALKTRSSNSGQRQSMKRILKEIYCNVERSN